MGPFELMDLVGVDVGFEVSKSFWEQSFHEPRWQPHPIQAKMVAAGRHGRKAGRGYYDYEDGPHRPDDPPPPPATQDPGEMPDDGVIEAPDVQLISLRDGSLAELSPRPEEVGWFALPPVAEAPLVELTRGPATTDEQAAEAELLLRLARQARRVGRRLAGPRPRPDRVAARQRGRIRARQGDRDRGGHRHRDAARLQLSARPARVGRRDRLSRTSSRRSTRCTASSARSATAPRRCCAGWPPRAERRPSPARRRRDRPRRAAARRRSACGRAACPRPRATTRSGSAPARRSSRR